MSVYFGNLNYTQSTSILNENIQGPTGAGVLLGGSGNNTINGDNNANVINGQAGHDTLNGNDGQDTIYGGNGNDEIRGGAGADTSYGGNGNDTIYSNAGSDDIFGGAGNDTIFVSSNKTFVDAGSGSNSITATGGYQNAYYWGGIGKHFIYDDGGSDYLQITKFNWDELIFARYGTDIAISTLQDYNDNGRLDNYVYISSALPNGEPVPNVVNAGYIEQIITKDSSSNDLFSDPFFYDLVSDIELAEP